MYNSLIHNCACPYHGQLSDDVDMKYCENDFSESKEPPRRVGV